MEDGAGFRDHEELAWPNGGRGQDKEVSQWLADEPSTRAQPFETLHTLAVGIKAGRATSGPGSAGIDSAKG
jgi:hypothetical protein